MLSSHSRWELTWDSNAYSHNRKPSILPLIYPMISGVSNCYVTVLTSLHEYDVTIPTLQCVMSLCSHRYMNMMSQYLHYDKWSHCAHIATWIWCHNTYITICDVTVLTSLHEYDVTIPTLRCVISLCSHRYMNMMSQYLHYNVWCHCAHITTWIWSHNTYIIMCDITLLTSLHEYMEQRRHYTAVVWWHLVWQGKAVFVTSQCHFVIDS